MFIYIYILQLLFIHSYTCWPFDPLNSEVYMSNSISVLPLYILGYSQWIFYNEFFCNDSFQVSRPAVLTLCDGRQDFNFWHNQVYVIDTKSTRVLGPNQSPTQLLLVETSREC